MLPSASRPTVPKGQPLTPRRFPLRTCVACRTERQKRDLLRIVRAPDGVVRFDPGGRAAGRGAYICADGACWSAAIKHKSIERALSASLPLDLRGQLERGELVDTQRGR